MDTDILLSILDEAVNIVLQVSEAEKKLRQLPYGNIVMHKSANRKHIYAYHHYNNNKQRMQKRLHLSDDALEEFRSQIMLQHQYKEEVKQGLRYLKQDRILIRDCYSRVSKNFSESFMPIVKSALRKGHI